VRWSVREVAFPCFRARNTVFPKGEGEREGGERTLISGCSVRETPNSEAHLCWLCAGSVLALRWLCAGLGAAPLPANTTAVTVPQACQTREKMHGPSM